MDCEGAIRSGSEIKVRQRFNQKRSEINNWFSNVDVTIRHQSNNVEFSPQVILYHQVEVWSLGGSPVGDACSVRVGVESSGRGGVVSAAVG